MAVYKRTYKPYAGALTRSWSRFAVLPRYALDDLRDSRLLLAYRLLCFVPFLVEFAMIYLVHSSTAQALVGLGSNAPKLFAVDEMFFYRCLAVQQGLAFFLAAWVGPGLVAPDLRDNAMPLYLCRPFSRAEYVLGKMSVLFYMLSSITWVPLLTLFLLQANLEGNGWGWANFKIARAIFISSLIWIFLTSLMALALSAWVKWRIAASGLMFAFFFVLAGFGTIFDAVLRTYWGKLVNINYLMWIVSRGLFDLPIATTRRFRVRPWEEADVPLWSAWVMLGLVCLASLWLLNRRLRAKEVNG